MQEQHSSRAGDRLGIQTSALVHAGGLAGGRVQEAQNHAATIACSPRRLGSSHLLL